MRFEKEDSYRILFEMVLDDIVAKYRSDKNNHVIMVENKNKQLAVMNYFADEASRERKNIVR